MGLVKGSYDVTMSVRLSVQDLIFGGFEKYDGMWNVVVLRIGSTNI